MCKVITFKLYLISDFEPQPEPIDEEIQLICIFLFKCKSSKYSLAV